MVSRKHLLYFFIFVQHVYHIHAGVIEQYLTSLANDEKVLLQEFFSLTGLNKSSWELYQAEQRIAYQKRERSVILHVPKFFTELATQIKNALYPNKHDRRLQAIIALLFKRLGIHHKEIPLKFSYSRRAFATDYALHFYAHNIFSFNATLEEIEASILHELQHYILKDSSTTFFMESYVSRHKDTIDQQRWKKFIKRWRHFIERRADLRAGLVCIAYAKALADLYEKFLVRSASGDKETDTHPTYSVRAEYMTTLYKAMREDPTARSGSLNVCMVEGNY